VNTTSRMCLGDGVTVRVLVSLRSAVSTKLTRSGQNRILKINVGERGGATFMRAAPAPSLNEADIGLVGVPTNWEITIRPDARHGTREICNALSLLRVDRDRKAGSYARTRLTPSTLHGWRSVSLNKRLGNLADVRHKAVSSPTYKSPRFRRCGLGLNSVSFLVL